MNADAKVWLDDNGSGWVDWRGIHDGGCSDREHRGTLMETLVGIETCLGQQLRWEFHVYPGKKAGLVGYRA